MQEFAPKTFFTSDCHFFHANIIRFCDRPFESVEEMNLSLINNWNKTVTPRDTVYLLGDISFGPFEPTLEILKSLNGRKNLIFGNHDKMLKNQIGKLLNVFDELSDCKEIKVQKQDIVLFHFPLRSWHKQHYGAWHLHGHTHGKLAPLGKSVDVGVDANYILGYPPYRPISFDEIKDFMGHLQSGLNPNP